MSDSETARSSVCPSCSKPTTTGTQFCLNCGALMNGGQQTAGKSFCGSCGHARTSDAVFCEKCGVHFTGGQQIATGVAPNLSQPMLPQSPQSSPSPSLERPQARSRRTRFIIGGVVALVLIVLVYFSPYISAYKLKRAAEANDIDALKDRVDFPAVRKSLKEAAQDEITKTQAAESKADLLAGATSLIDTMMTPMNSDRPGTWSIEMSETNSSSE